MAEHYDWFREPDRPGMRPTGELSAFACHRDDFRWWTNLMPLKNKWLGRA